MILFRTLGIAVRALARNRLRTLLTILGITIGIAAVICTVALGAGSAALIQQQMANLGDNFIWIENGAANVGGVRIGAATVAKLTVEDSQAMVQEIPSIVRCSPNVDGRIQVIHGDQNWYTQYRGVSPDYLLIKAWPVVLGTSFSDYDDANRSRVVILGQTLVRQLFGDEDPIGQSMRFGSIPVMVVGVLQGRGNSTTGQDQDDTIFLPYTTAMHFLHGNRPYIDDVMCSATTNAAIPTARDAIADLLRARHRLADGAPDDFNLRTPEDSLRLQADTANTMQAFLSAVASVSLLVGGVGVMNIMLVSVTERTREIGLRMAIGARERDVRVQFLAEAATLGALGGIFGVAAGLVASNGIAQSNGWPMVVSTQTIAWSVAFSAAVGLVFGYYPARRAAALDPIEALRIE